MVSQKDSVYAEILDDLEDSFAKGEIDESTYYELKKRYSKKLEEERLHPTDPQINAYTDIHYKVRGSNTVTSDALKISGSGRIPGGIVPKTLKVSGSCKILDNIEVKGVQCSGWLRSAGSVVSHGDIHVSGAFKANGNVSVTGKVEISGSGKVNGNFDSTGICTVSGFMRTDGSMKATEGLKVSGRIRTNGSVSSEKEVNIKGIAKIEGDVIADIVKFKAPDPLRRVLGRLGRTHVQGDVVGHGMVDVDNLQVDGDIRGRIVKIGDNCKIKGKIYYVDELMLAEDVKLESAPVKIPSNQLGNQTQRLQTIQDASKNGIEPSSKPMLARFCPKCGQEVGQGKKFCPACGSQL